MPLARARRSLERLRGIATGALHLDAPKLRLDPDLARELFASQLYCRLTDIEAHELRARNEGYYTICSAGHEGNVALGHLTTSMDPALLHYRSGALFLARARASQDAVDDAPAGVRELLLSLSASASDPISGGRHKVFGSIPWGIPPQTSTIASHLPKAVGMAVAIDRAARLRSRHGVMSGGPTSVATRADSIVVCSFGDASLNHSTAQGALNAAAWAAFQRIPVPALFVCEDNGIGVSVRTPAGWVEARMRAMPGITYVAADGRDLSAVYEQTRAAVESCRSTRMPVFLHLRCERVWGHAGSDADGEYRLPHELATAEASDPVLLTAQSLLDAGVLDTASLLGTIERAFAVVQRLSRDAVTQPKLATRDEVMASIADDHPDRVALEARRTNYAASDELDKPRPLGHGIRAALGELMRKYPEMIVFGEDVAEKGGVYGVTGGLWKTFGAARVFNTLLDEQTILGMAIGAGQVGLLPVPEIQFLAYLHNAEDQLRGEAATLSFFSRAQLTNPMVVRIAGLGYQKGFGGHFHNDDSLAVLRDIPGIIVAVPSRADDAAAILRTLCAAARIDGRVCVFVEPIALYHTRDLHPGDGRWSFPLPARDVAIGIGEVGVYENGQKIDAGPAASDLVIFTYGNGVPMALRTAAQLEGTRVRVIDLRWIAPLPEAAIRAHAEQASSILVVDECRRSGNVSEAIAAVFAELPVLRAKPFARVTSADSFIPLADAANLVLLQEPEILDAARSLIEK
ncbi:MAG: MFS transporter [Deltaproteobacteria bacterium]|nr:MFS transporter [Deltaproteobacteria bacterium]